MTKSTDPILIDCDGVCADFLGGLFNRLNYKGPPLTTFNFTAVLDPEQQIRAEKILNTYEFWASLEPIPGAKPAIAFIRSLGFAVHWVTSPWHTSPTWGSARRWWLHEHFGAIGTEITITHRKDLVRGLALIDDKPAHVKAWHERNPDGLAFLFAQSYNADTPEADYTHRIDWRTLPAAFKAISMIIDDKPLEEELKTLIELWPDIEEPTP